MFTQFTLSLNSSNFTFKIELDDKALTFFKEEKALIEKKINLIEKDFIKDEYEGEILGIAFRETTNDFMIKELHSWKKFFESHGLKVFEPKVVSLKNRLEDLNKIQGKNRELIVECY